MNKLYSPYPIEYLNLTIVVEVDEDNKVVNAFHKKFVDIKPSPVIIKSYKDLNQWFSDHMSYYFQQFKFAFFCASAACGVSKDNLTQGLPLNKSIMAFHVLYQTKKLLAQMEVRNPNDPDFNPYNNPYNKTEYHKILNEFNLREQDVPNIDQPTDGLGYMRVSYGPSAQVWSGDKTVNYYNKRNDPLPTYPQSGKTIEYRSVTPGMMGDGKNWQFPPWGAGAGGHIDSITQEAFGYQRLMPDHSKQFTDPGIVRLNDSIRAYVYCILGSQVQARQAGSSLESQQEFVTLVNDLINKKQSLQDSIKNFEDALSKTQGKIDYVIAKGLYMIPSNMMLNKLGMRVDGFNDKLRIANTFDKVGKEPEPPKQKSKPVIKQKPEPPKQKSKLLIKQPVKSTMLTAAPIADTHEGKKLLIGSAVVTAGVAYSLFA